MLGYDLYSSALADILSEPTMQPPICVGLYAQWGSGKSFLLKKLEGKGRVRSPGLVFCEQRGTGSRVWARAPHGALRRKQQGFGSPRRSSTLV